jgi:hypothetical protein
MLTEPSYTVRIEFAQPEQGAQCYIDLFTLNSIAGTVQSSWGSIKHLYR